MSDREHFVVKALIPTCLGGLLRYGLAHVEICRRLVDFRGSAELTIGVYRGPARVARTRNRKIPKSKSHITVVIVRNSEWSDPGCQGGLRTRRSVVSRSRRSSGLPYRQSFVSTCGASSQYAVH